MEGNLHKEYKPKNVEELKESMAPIRQSIPADVLSDARDAGHPRPSQPWILTLPSTQVTLSN